MNVFWLDTETTGLDPRINSIIDLSCIVESDHIDRACLNLKIRPTEPFDQIDREALEINGFCIDEVTTFEDAKEAVRQIVYTLRPYITDKRSRFIIAAQNASFDRDFLREMFSRCGFSADFNEIFHHNMLDTASIFTMYRYNGWLDTDSSSLSAAAQFLGITYNAHNSMHDLYAMRRAFRMLSAGTKFSMEV